MEKIHLTLVENLALNFHVLFFAKEALNYLVLLLAKEDETMRHLSLEQYFRHEQLLVFMIQETILVS